MSGQLIILRHGESTWNARGVWTGTRNAELTDKGRHDVQLMGELCRGLHVDLAFVSQQVRTLQTLQGVLQGMGGHLEVPHQATGAINERDYGDYTGKNKWDMEKLLGPGKFNDIRRGWNIPIPGGETLKHVYERTVPFYLQTVVPRLLAGKNIMIVAHGNSIRSLMKYIESISDAGVQDLEMIFGSILIYNVNDQGRMTHKDIKHI